jgi:cytochrome c7-like protein
MRWPVAAAVAIALLTGGALLMVSACGDAGASPAQPIAFPHAPHTENQIACAFCHEFSDTRAAAGIPRTELCGSCHSAMPQESPATQKLMEYVDGQKEIPWVRVFEIPQYTYFPHKWHVRAGVECEECHEGVGESVATARHIKLKMAWCMDCHEERQASIDCVTCHK